MREFERKEKKIFSLFVKRLAKNFQPLRAKRAGVQNSLKEQQ